MNTISGLIKPRYGKVEINNEDISDLPIYIRTKKYKMSIIPQFGGAFASLTTEQNLRAVAEILIEDAKILEEAGCFALILEKVPAELAAKVAKEVTIPVIGIGAGGGIDGQVLVVHDMLGITQEFSPRFLRRYHNLYEEMRGAFKNYISDVKSGDFPNEKEQY